jgi:hypothetical protein
MEPFFSSQASLLLTGEHCKRATYLIPKGVYVSNLQHRPSSVVLGLSLPGGLPPMTQAILLATQIHPMTHLIDRIAKENNVPGMVLLLFSVLLAATLSTSETLKLLHESVTLLRSTSTKWNYSRKEISFTIGMQQTSIQSSEEIIDESCPLVLLLPSGLFIQLQMVITMALKKQNRKITKLVTAYFLFRKKVIIIQ